MPAVIELLGVPHGTFEFPEWLGMVCARHEALTSLHLAFFGLQSVSTRCACVSLGAGLLVPFSALIEFKDKCCLGFDAQP